MHSKLSTLRPARPGWLGWLVCAVAWLLVVLPVRAQSQEPDYAALAQKWARNAAASVSADPAAPPLRLEVTVGALDSRLRLAPCANVEPYMPPGARLWGRSRVGLRCVDGMVKWNVSLPLTVKAYGQAWVVRGQVMAGSPVTQGDVVATEVDWAEDTSPVLIDPAHWLGQTATRNLGTGQVLRAGAVRPTQVFQAGSQVRVVAEGPGFSVSSDAQALTAGVVGQSTRVRMDNGRITNGMVLDARTVRVDL